MKDVHAIVGGWLSEAGCAVRIDAVGNLRAVRGTDQEVRPTFVIGSHLDTVPNAGAFDGILGVMLGVTLLEDLAGRALPYAIELIGFSEEEGVRYGVPRHPGSRAVWYMGSLDADLIERISGDIRDFGLRPGAHSRGQAAGQCVRISGVSHRARSCAGASRLAAGYCRRRRRTEPADTSLRRQGQPRRHDSDGAAPRCAGRCRAVDRRRGAHRVRHSAACGATVGRIAVEPDGNVIAGRPPMSASTCVTYR